MTKLAHITNGLVYVPSPLTGTTKAFLRVHGGLAWGDSTSDDKSESYHAVVIAGEEENHRINVFRQASAKWPDFLDQLIVLKDTLLVQYYHIPPSSRKVTESASGLLKPGEPTGFRDQLFDLDGLGRYKIRGRNQWKQPIFVEGEPAEKWPTFRTDLDNRPVVIICDYPDRFLLDFEAARLLVAGLIDAGEVVGDPKLLGNFEKASHQKPGDAMRQPIFRAFVGICWTLWNTSEARRHGQKQETPDFSTWKEFTR